MYVLDSFIKSDFRNTIFSSVKDSKIFFRSFDPVETSRMSGTKAIEEITSSSGVIIPFLNHQHEDSSRHNLRAAFMAGLSHGAKKATLLIQRNDGPIPADFRDEVAVVEDEMQLRELVGEFSERALREMQSVEAFKPRMSFGLGALTLGQSAAENEFRNLGNYFFETSEFLKACRGEVRIVAGRKGSGKTAIFFQVRDRVRSDRSAMVIDLKPESHQLSLFREELLNVADRGLFDHTIAGFWNFVLLSEIVLAYRKQLEWQSKFDANALGKVSRIDAELDSNLLLQSGDFTARLNALGREMTEEIRAISARKEKLTPERITNLVYEIGVAKVRGLITELSSGTDRIVFLFDNIDKGWNANRVDDFDIRLVRLLIEGLEKLRHDMAKIGIDFVSTVFLRNDIYELLLNQTTDRGKAGLEVIDWSDRSKLKHLVFLRMRDSIGEDDATFESLWKRYFAQRVGEQGSFEFLVDHCLMRPRFLLNILEYCLSNAVNRGHSKVKEDDMRDAVSQHANYLVGEFGYEVRDASGLPYDMFYALIGADQAGSREYFERKFVEEFEFSEADARTSVETMVWYGLLGLVQGVGRVSYIYDFGYDKRRMDAACKLEQGSEKGLRFCINPALYAGLAYG